jgi:hypothetical protein
VEYERRDGLITYSLRVTVDGERLRLRLGTQRTGGLRPVRIGRRCRRCGAGRRRAAPPRGRGRGRPRRRAASAARARPDEPSISPVGVVGSVRSRPARRAQPGDGGRDRGAGGAGHRASTSGMLGFRTEPPRPTGRGSQRDQRRAAAELADHRAEVVQQLWRCVPPVRRRRASSRARQPRGAACTRSASPTHPPRPIGPLLPTPLVRFSGGAQPAAT